MKIKYLILISLTVILSGCSANYEINIDNDNIHESLTINNTDINKFKSINIPIDYEIDDVEIYDKKEENIDYYNIETNNKDAKIYYNFNSDNFNTSMLFKTCYENTVFTKDDYELLITTSDKFSCFDNYEELDDITIKITSKYKLINTNADKYDKYNYYWYINKDNKDNKKIILRLDTTTILKSLLEILTSIGLITPIILVSIILITILIIKIVKIEGRRRNKI